MKILVVIPHNGRISNHTLQSVEGIKDGDGLEFRFSSHPGSVFIADNRNDQCYNADGLLSWPDAFLFIDGDMDFNLSDIHSLASRDGDVCCGAYCYKEAPLADFLVAGMWLSGFPGISGKAPGFRSSVTTGCFPVDWTGAGFMLVKKAVLHKMPYPWFYHPVMPVPPGAGPFPQKAVGEDVGFCLRAREAGINVFLDADVRIGHKKGASMEPKKEGIPADIDQMVMGINRALLEAADGYRKLSTIAQALKAENDKLKAELAAKETPIHEDPKA